MALHMQKDPPAVVVMQSPKLPSSPPHSADTLERIEAKLDRIDRALAPLAALASAPAIAGAAVDAFDQGVQGQEAQLDARLHAVFELLERISRPSTMAMLGRAVDMLEALPALVATATDAVDELADPDGLDIHGRLEAAMSLLRRMTHPETLRLLEHLLDQVTNPEPVRTGIPMLDAHATQDMGMETLTREGLQLVGQVVVFLRHAQAQGGRRLGLLGLLKALRDPSTQRAVGFAMSVLEGLGQALDGRPDPRSLPA